MEESDKRKYNGFDGFCNNALFSSDNAFIREDKAKLERRVNRERKLKENQNG